jgi:hypothetical protein
LFEDYIETGHFDAPYDRNKNELDLMRILDRRKREKMCLRNGCQTVIN